VLKIREDCVIKTLFNLAPNILGPRNRENTVILFNNIFSTYKTLSKIMSRKIHSMYALRHCISDPDSKDPLFVREEVDSVPIHTAQCNINAVCTHFTLFIKGTLAQNFRPLVFFHQRTHGPLLHGLKAFFAHGFVFAEIFDYEIEVVSAVLHKLQDCRFCHPKSK
jgi:hypothetical protein